MNETLAQIDWYGVINLAAVLILGALLWKDRALLARALDVLGDVAARTPSHLDDTVIEIIEDVLGLDESGDDANANLN